ncbi:DUF4242 domain-containing protein [Flagellimonas sp. 2504JD4-2]
MKTTRSSALVGVLILMAIFTTNAQEEKETKELKTYLIEREIPNAGELTAEELQGISQKSCAVLKQMDTGIEWLHSYVTDDKVYCLYKAENKDLIRKHAEEGGFPVNSIQELSSKIGPATALGHELDGKENR